jgi:outer membrane protein OmpA-like peptidoglycan-associated protein/opacity protein-like surface antigen
MSSRSQVSCSRFAWIALAVLAVLCAVGGSAAAQDRPAPKWELFGGYSFLYPNSDVHAMLPGGLLPVASPLESNPRGLGGSLTYDFNRWFGLTLDGSTSFHSGETGFSMLIDDTAFSNISFGPKVTFRGRHVAPFLEALVGDHQLAPDTLHDINKLGFMFGGGLDFKLTKHVDLRLPRVDYVWSSYRYGPSGTTGSTDLRGIRGQAGLVFVWGGERRIIPPQASCSIQPSEVWAGEPVSATAEGSSFNPKRTVVYKWSGSGVKTGESGKSTQIDTNGLQPGPYQLTASLSDGSPSGIASCSSRFMVKEPHPPLISCSADPASVAFGGTSMITAAASSPDGRRLTYSYASSAGNVTGSDSSATLYTTGAQAGRITVTCNVADDRNQPLTASASTMVELRSPPPPPMPDVSAIEKRLALHSVYFETAKPRASDPEAGLLASQEKTLRALSSDFLIYLQVKPDARLTLKGHADPRGTQEYNQALSERRVGRVKGFLVSLGVPADSIQTEAFGEQKNLTDRQVREAVEKNPELSTEDRKRVLDNMRTIILASNRRVDITLSNAGQASQESVREYPFNAADSLTLLKEEGTGKAMRPAHARKPRHKAQP